MRCRVPVELLKLSKEDFESGFNEEWQAGNWPQVSGQLQPSGGKRAARAAEGGQVSGAMRAAGSAATAASQGIGRGSADGVAEAGVAGGVAGEAAEDAALRAAAEELEKARLLGFIQMVSPKRTWHLRRGEAVFVEGDAVDRFFILKGGSLFVLQVRRAFQRSSVGVGVGSCGVRILIGSRTPSESVAGPVFE